MYNSGMYVYATSVSGGCGEISSVRLASSVKQCVVTVSRIVPA